MPLGDKYQQMLIRLTVQADGSDTLENLYAVRFVPLIGAEGWSAEKGRPA